MLYGIKKQGAADLELFDACDDGEAVAKTMYWTQPSHVLVRAGQSVRPVAGWIPVARTSDQRVSLHRWVRS